MHKSEAMMQECLANEWKAQVKPEVTGAFIAEGLPEIYYRLYAIRGNETLIVEWRNNLMQGASYTYGSNYSLKLNWKNQVMKLVTGKPDPKRLDVAEAEESKYVPWDTETSDEDVIASVKGCTISWVRSIDKEVCTAMVPIDRERQSLKVSRAKSDPSKRFLEWVDPFGFHAVYLDQIIQVV